jgi:hypothetical protein
MKVQLWSQDEYGTGSIVGTFDGPTSHVQAMNKASQLVTDANFGNSLTASEQLSSVEAYLIEFVDGNGEADNSVVYASARPDGKHRAMKVGSNDLAVLDPKTTSVRVYIGSKFAKQPDKSKVETRLYMKDSKGRPVTSLTHESLQKKTVYFIRKV